MALGVVGSIPIILPTRFRETGLGVRALSGAMKKQTTPKKKLVLATQTIRALEPDALAAAQGAGRGSTVPRSWCMSCETYCE